MNLQTKLLIYLCLFAIIDIVIPIPIMSILLIYVLLNKPPWFSKMVSDIYNADSNVS
jgi:hypothetical protein